MVAEVHPPKLLTCEQAAEILGLKVQTLASWRLNQRHGLPFIRVGRSIRYREQDLLDWLRTRTVGAVGQE